jgi:hypothetical protein
LRSVTRGKTLAGDAPRDFAQIRVARALLQVSAHPNQEHRMLTTIDTNSLDTVSGGTVRSSSSSSTQLQMLQQLQTTLSQQSQTNNNSNMPMMMAMAMMANRPRRDPVVYYSAW